MDTNSRNFGNANGPKNGKSLKRQAKLLVQRDDPLRSVKRALDEILLVLGDALPAEIRQSVAETRNAAWELFKKEEESLNEKAR